MVNSKRFLLFERIWKALISIYLQKEIDQHYSLIPRDQKFHCVVNVFPIGHATLHRRVVIKSRGPGIFPGY